MPPRPNWYRGLAAIGAFLAAVPFAQPGRWRRLPAAANGQLAFGVYGSCERTGRDGAHAIELLTLDGDARIVAVTAFHSPELFERFGLPARIA